MMQNYIEDKHDFKVYTAYIVEAKHDLGLPMYDAQKQ